MQNLGRKLVTVSLSLCSVLVSVNPAKANVNEWVRNFNNQFRKDYRTALNCADGKLDAATCRSFDRRMHINNSLNEGAAASQQIRNSVQRSNYNLINSKNYHNAVRNSNDYCNSGDVQNCKYWLERVELYRQPY